MRIHRKTLATILGCLGAWAGSAKAQYTPYQQSAGAPAAAAPAAVAAKPGDVMPSQPYAFPYSAQPGVAEMPWCGSSHAGDSVGGCNGPVGANGPITYELYIRTGPNILAGANAFKDAINNGWTVQGGGRTLLFNTQRDAAWVIDLGLGYTRNEGNALDAPVNIAPSSLRFGATTDNAPQPFGVKFLNRTSFNYGLGRDVWLNGPGAVGAETFGNWRFGADVGGRYGTSSVGFVSPNDPFGTRRRQAIFNGVYVGTGLNWEKPFGATTLFAGLRAEWSYNWMNMLIPNNSDISDVNILMNFGVRF
jgi:hypothetical protein